MFLPSGPFLRVRGSDGYGLRICVAETDTNTLYSPLRTIQDRKRAIERNYIGTPEGKTGTWQ